ncbi:predicted protein [Nematostella vectensis]|uniref:Uncharacterized protein n=1 Tax=Nematostella vectensis TaxID=45351 RepID=A7RLZ0_NEMVE|nr:predicted protein [Nematostella vectensis]|eukprot:XP_001639571.1 predicted protein [Nematostella vectensis]
MAGHESPYVRTAKLPRRQTLERSIIRPRTTPATKQKADTFGLPFTPKRLSYRVERALRHFEDDKEFCFYKGRPQRMVITERGEIRSPTPLNKAAEFYQSFSKENLFTNEDEENSVDTSGEMSYSTESTDSVSLNPGVLTDKNPKPRIFVRYRQLSAHELVMEWLFRSCNHPCKTLPLI